MPPEAIPEAAVAGSEVARLEVREFLVEVLDPSSSASEHTRHDRLNSQPPQHFS